MLVAIMLISSLGLIIAYDYLTITRAKLKFSDVLTLKPTASAIAVLKLQRNMNSQCCRSADDIMHSIEDMIYCRYSISTTNDVDVLDDDHFCSRLCDAGYRVHIVEISNYETTLGSSQDEYGYERDSINHWNNMFTEAVEFIKDSYHLSRCHSSVAIIGEELTVSHLLNYLAEVRYSTFNTTKCHVAVV
jgi:hypothetical protein